MGMDKTIEVSKDTNPKDAIAGTKIPLWLLSPVAKAYWAVAQFAGMIKYGAWNWRAAGVRNSVYTSAARRHLDAYESGEETDPADGTHHLGNVMACCGIILDARAAGKLLDDRPPSVSLRPAYAEQEAVMAKLREQYKDKSPRHWTIADTEKPKGFDTSGGVDSLPKLEKGARVRIKGTNWDGGTGRIEYVDLDRIGRSRGFPYRVDLDAGGRVYFSALELVELSRV